MMLPLSWTPIWMIPPSALENATTASRIAAEEVEAFHSTYCPSRKISRNSSSDIIIGGSSRQSKWNGGNGSLAGTVGTKNQDNHFQSRLTRSIANRTFATYNGQYEQAEHR